MINTCNHPIEHIADEVEDESTRRNSGHPHLWGTRSIGRYMHAGANINSFKISQRHSAMRYHL